MLTVLELGGEWRMREADAAAWLPAQVPGTVLTDLLRSGQIADPFYRQNEDTARALSYKEYEYEREFEVPAAVLDAEHAELVFEGLDTLADVYLNDVCILRADNMHRTWRIEAGPYLKQKGNRLRIWFHSPTAYTDRAEKEGCIHYVSCGSLSGAQYLRKPHSMFGWDWGPQMPDAGIWRPVRLECWSGSRLEDVRIHQEHQENGVRLSVDIRPAGDAAGLTAAVQVVSPQGDTVLQSETEEKDGVIAWSGLVEQPQLWWPHGYGGQPLYRLLITLYAGGEAVDRQEKRIGLRTLTVSRKPDDYGEEFAFVVNGIKIFSMGADYIPEDSLYGRMTAGKTRRLLEDCVKANYNTIRVWGGGYYPPEWFFDACDELGLIVWQDFMYACLIYEVTDAFVESITAESVDNLRRFRHHACLGLLCGNNENEMGWLSWDYEGCSSPRHKQDYLRLFEEILPGIVEREAPDVFYWPSSPSAGGNFRHTLDDGYGDSHYWAVWHGRLPFEEYTRHYFRYCSEYGFQSFPCAKTVNQFTEPEDRNIFSPVMEQHQKNGTANERILTYLAEYYRYPYSYETLLYASQLLQAEAIKTGAEHFRRHRGRCMGSLYWQVNDCWPVASWASIDYYGRWKGLHYYARRFYAPLLASCAIEEDTYALHVSNESRDTRQLRLVYALKDTQGREWARGEYPVTCAPLSTQMVCRDTLPADCPRDRVYIVFRLLDGDDMVSGGSEIFCRPKHFAFADPQLSLSAKETVDAFAVTVAAKAYAKSVALDLQDIDAVFSDNWMDLDAGETRTVLLDKADLPAGMTAALLQEQLEVRSIYQIGR